MTDENKIESALKQRLEENLTAAKYSGPAKLLGTGITDLLMDVLFSLLDGCFSANKGLSHLVGKKLNLFEKSKLRTELRRSMYNGSRRQYGLQDGESVHAAMVLTLEASEEDEQKTLVAYVEQGAREWQQTDYTWR